MEGESIKIKKENITTTTDIFGEDLFVDFRDEIFQGSGVRENILKLEEKIRKVYESFLYFQDLYQMYGHDGTNITLSNYSITNFNVFENLLIVYRNSIISVVAKYKDDQDIEKFNISIEGIRSEKFFIKHYLEIARKIYNKDNDLNDMPEANFDVFSTKELMERSDLCEEMLDVYSKNYNIYPKFSKKAIKGLEESFHNESSTFIILTYQKKLVGFYRLNDVNEKTVHFSAFNLKDDYKGVLFGEFMISQYLDKLAKEKVIEAECHQYTAISANYVERGFVVSAYRDIEEIGALNIIRDDLHFDFESKKLSKEEIVQRYVRGQLNPGSENLTIICAEKQTDFDFEKMLADGQNVVTRYFKFGEKGKEKWYVVLEQKLKEIL